MNGKQQSIVSAALLAVRKTLKNCSKDDFPTEEQLLSVEKELSDMLSELHEGKVTEGRSGLARMVVDQWPLDNELADLICGAVQAHRSAV